MRILKTAELNNNKNIVIEKQTDFSIYRIYEENFKLSDDSKNKLITTISCRLNPKVKVGFQYPNGSLVNSPNVYKENTKPELIMLKNAEVIETRLVDVFNGLTFYIVVFQSDYTWSE